VTYFKVYFKNKFEKLLHLVGFIIRKNLDARSSECQISDVVGSTSSMVTCLP